MTTEFPDTEFPDAPGSEAEFDDRLFRTELIYSDIDDSAWVDRKGWSLFIDGVLIAHTAQPLPAAAAQIWGSAQLGEGMDWLQGHRTGDFYWVATPAPLHLRTAAAATAPATAGAGV